MLLWIGVGLAVLVLGYAAWLFQSMIGLSFRVDSAWSEVDALLKARWAVVSDLVAALGGGPAVAEVAAARDAAEGAVNENPSGRGEAERGLVAALGGLFAAAEGGPAWQADGRCSELRAALEGLEGRVAEAGALYNAAVARLNAAVRAFPGVVVAALAEFHPRPYFQPGAAAAVDAARPGALRTAET